MFLNTISQNDGWFAKEIKLQGKKIDLLSLHNVNPAKYPYFLDSSSRGNKKNRFSILFYNPKVVLEKKESDKFFFLKQFDEIWKRDKQKQSNITLNNKIIPFGGGWFLYLGYELAKEIEPSLKIPPSPFKMPTAFASRVHTAIIYDNVDDEFFIVSDNSQSFDRDVLVIEKDLSKIYDEKNKKKGTIKILMKGSEFEHQHQVKKCIKYIFQGEIFQANLSRIWKFEISKNVKSSDIYRQLRFKNPSPFAGLINYKNSSIISSSPERLVSVFEEKLETRPIAGTRPRGSSGLQDIELSKELINSDKEKAEHLMLVDLERNDISKVCKPGSVEVNEMMTIESYAHVHHIVSNIRGEKLDNVTPGKIISSVFPGGTITGCPKVRCMEILGELEQDGRGPYTGSFGYVTHSGNMDINILIRSMLRENNKLFFRAGGGIVADSVPENETFETEAKANGMLKALGFFKDA